MSSRVRRVPAAVAVVAAALPARTGTRSTWRRARGRGRPPSPEPILFPLTVTGSVPRVLGPAPLQQANNFYRFVAVGAHVYGVYWSLAKTAPGSVPAVFNLN
jgi:hypothetical protein